jgi:hypothetical protein
VSSDDSSAPESTFSDKCEITLFGDRRSPSPESGSRGVRLFTALYFGAPRVGDPLSLYSGPAPKQERENEQNDKQHEENMGYPGGFARYATKSEDFGDNGYNQKKKCPT